ncbi:50S ribosomal protein-like protein YmL27 [Cadophora sp. MPI-SDFR-AT-0126]|nr:50S ribosomal protein-like protein YmL27 [Leotiomycetes sp. MPI-SDFR-AT-0126]
MKPTQALAKRLKRLALTTKATNKGYYKGTGTGPMGTHTKHGGYIIDWDRVRTYVVPQNLKDFKLTPFVTKNMKRTQGRFEGDPKGAVSGAAYLKKWKDENGED